MPIKPTNYIKRPVFMINRHFETIIPSLFFKVEGVNYERERMELEDGDFLDLDWVKNGSNRLIILSHGLEGSSSRHYIMRPAKFFSTKGWDILAWNNRSCSGEMNRLPRFYHHGATEDIAAVVDRGLKEYDEIVLIGYSMGGGMQQKYLGERKVDERIKGAISFSVPCNIRDSADQLRKKGNQFYERRFIKKLKEKVRKKSILMKVPFDLDKFEKVETFPQLDYELTLKVHKEFKDPDDFYAKVSSDQFLPNIQVPLLIVNALNDPMLGERCYPVALAETSELIYLETPKIGGHVGFTMPRKTYSYMEYASAKFIEEVIFEFHSSVA